MYVAKLLHILPTFVLIYQISNFYIRQFAKMGNNIIYLDYAATTPTDQRVVDSMLPFFTQKFGNAASRTHFYGQEAADAVKTAREQLVDISEG